MVFFLEIKFDVPDDITRLLDSAANNWENTPASERYINQALAKAGDNTDVLIAAYRYFFYKNNWAIAREVAKRVIETIARSECLPPNWEELKPILMERRSDSSIRLYLNACSAYSLVLAKLGETEEAKTIVAKVKEIDFQNEFGASVLLDILTKSDEEE